MDRPDSAIQWLRLAAEEGFPCYPLFARDPALDGLRSEPRFVALLEELRLQHDLYRSRPVLPSVTRGSDESGRAAVPAARTR